MSEALPAPGFAMRCIGASVAPFAIVSAYLWLSRWPTRWFTAASDYAALGVAIVTFAICVLALPLKRKKKVMIVAFGVPLVAVALALFSLVFVGAAFGDWL